MEDGAREGNLMQRRVLLLVPILWAALGSAVHADFEAILMTEVMASNRTALADEDGDHSDWFELYNSGDTAVDLEGFWATDSANDLQRWEFPAVSIEPGRFLVVFCSEKDRRRPGEELHTNFRLEAAGELLALVTPDGQTLVAGFAPTFPPQIEDVSYGVSSGSTFTTVVDDSSPLTVHVPSDGSLGTSWTAVGFDDGSWRQGTPGVGTERSSGFEQFISTDVEADMHGVNSTIYIRVPFVVDDPDAIDAIQLRIRYDDGFAAYINGELATVANAPDPLDWDSRSSRSHADNAAIQLVDFDLTSAVDALVPGDNVLAIQGLNFSSTSSDFLIDPRLDLVSIGDIDQGAAEYFESSTPGGPNQVGFPAYSEDPEFSHPSGGYATNFNLSLSAPPDATIRYTTNGTRPTESSSVYSGPIAINETTIVHARTWEEGKAAGRSVSQSYIRLATNVRTFSSNLPIVVIDTRGGAVGENAYTDIVVETILTTDGRARLTDPAEFAGRGGLKIRGSSSRGFPKKQWAMETLDEYGADRNVSLLGMAPESDWVVYAPYSDKSLIRNYLSYDWSNQIGMWAVDTRLCELFYKTGTGALTSGHYHGVYVLMEKIKRGNDRVDVERLGPADAAEPEVTGGYIFKKDRLDPGDSGFRTSRGQTLAYVYPKEREIPSAQSTYLRGALNAFESALYGANFTDPEIGYAGHADPQSFVEHHILVEVTKNIDGYRLSTFFHKPRNGRIFSGPIWDYNLSLGNADYLQGWQPQGWYYPQLGADAYPYWPRMFQDREFQQRYIDTWQDLREDEFATEKLLTQVDEITAHLEESQVRNFDRWRILGTRVWPNWYIADTYAQEITFMKDWLQQRLAWMDSNYLAKPILTPDGGGFDAPLELRMAAAAGTIYYTVDGTDPRLPGGGVAPTAESYGFSASLTLVSEEVTDEVRVHVPTSSLGTSWTGVGYDDSSWTRGTSGLGVGYEESSGYEDYITVDVGADMVDLRTSVYARYRFEIDDPDAISFLSLRMMYDDGFVAFVNGHRVTGANAPAIATWESAATAQHDDGAAVIFETFNLADAAEHLRAGTNVLAIQGLNTNTSSSDLLILPELLASSTAEGDAIVLTERTTVRARATTGATNWSGLREETFVPFSDLPLRVSEIHYHPADLPEGSPHDASDLEFIEVVNIGGEPISLNGVRFTNGIDFDFTTGVLPTLEPGAFAVVVRDFAAFSWYYDTADIAVAGIYRGALDNDGDRLELLDADGHLIHDFRYEDEWHPTTDGGGSSLHVVDTGAPRAAWETPEQWTASVDDDGSPGRAEDSAPPQRGWQLPGDSNSDGRLDVSDSIRVLRILFTDASLPLPCGGDDPQSGGGLTVLDINADGSVDVTDAVSLLDYLFTAGGAPALGTDCVRVTACPNSCSI